MRWTRGYYRNSHCVFSSHVGCAADINVSTLDLLPTVEVLSQHQKYRKAFAIGQKLATIVSYTSTREFSYAIQCLEKVLKAWEKAQRVIIDIVNTETQNDDADKESANDDEDPCIDGDHIDCSGGNNDMFVGVARVNNLCADTVCADHDT